MAIDGDGNLDFVIVENNAVLTFDPSGKLARTEKAVEGGNDGLVILEDGTKYVGSVRFGRVSKVGPGRPAKVTAAGIRSAASTG